MEKEKKGFKNLFKKAASILAGSMASLGLIGSVDNTVIDTINQDFSEKTVLVENYLKPKLVPKLILKPNFANFELSKLAMHTSHGSHGSHGSHSSHSSHSSRTV